MSKTLHSSLRVATVIILPVLSVYVWHGQKAYLMVIQKVSFRLAEVAVLV